MRSNGQSPVRFELKNKRGNPKLTPLLFLIKTSGGTKSTAIRIGGKWRLPLNAPIDRIH